MKMVKRLVVFAFAAMLLTANVSGVAHAGVNNPGTAATINMYFDDVNNA